MHVTRLDELKIWQLARQFAEAVSELLERPGFRSDRKLSDQLGDSSASILSNIGEGFGQQSDRAFARHLFISRGSNNEARGQLAIALSRRYISQEEFGRLEALSIRMGKMITSLIIHLRKEDRRLRG